MKLKLPFKTCFISGILLLFSFFASSQAPEPQLLDSLRHVAENGASDTLRMATRAYWAKLIAPYDNAGNERLNLGIIDSCEQRLNTGLSPADSLFYRNKLSEAKGSIGVNYYLVANYPKSLQYLLEAAKGFGELNNLERQGFSYVVIGALFKNMGDLDAALTYHEKALTVQRKAKNKLGIALTYNNLGTTYLELNEIDQALDYFLQSLKMYEELEDQRGIGVELVNLGSTYQDLQQLDSALAYFERSLAIRKSINDKQGQIFSYARLGKVQLLLGDYKSALKNGKSSLSLAQEKGYPRGIRDANEVIAEVYKYQGQHQLALQHFESYITARDSISNEENIRSVTQAEYTFRYEAELAADSIQNEAAEQAYKAKLALKELENRQQKERSRLLWIAVALITLLGVFAYTRYRQAKRQKGTIAIQKAKLENSFNELEKRDGEKEVLLKEIHHRVKNNLQVISSLLDLQTLNMEDAQALSAVTDGQNRVKAMALIHEKLYQNENIALLNFREYVQQLIVQIAAIFPHGKSVERKVEVADVSLDIDTAIPLGLILCELITNVYKYAADHPQPTVLIGMNILKEGEYQLIVHDNGPGLPSDFDVSKAQSLGLRLVRRLSRQLYGIAEYEYVNGARFTITFMDTIKRKAVL